MRRILFIILSALVLTSAIAAEGQSAAHKKARSTKTTRTTKKKSTTRKAAAPAINVDSLNAARRAQAIADSLNRLNSGVAEGNVADIVELAQWYYTGHNVDLDYKQAADLYRQAADLGSVRAMEHLGLCYELGRGVKCDSVEAARLYMESIKGGNGTLFKQKLDSAATNAFDATIIATCYENGEGVKRDLSRAADLYAKAAALGSAYAIPCAALCYLNVGDTVSAMEYLPVGASLGNIACKFWTGKLSLDGSDTKQAVAYILEAADSGMAEAQDEAGLIYYEGKYLAASPTKAIDYLRESALQDYPKGMYDYGIALSNATHPDYCQAIYWLAKASEGGYEMGDFSGVTPQPFADYVAAMKAYLIDGDFATAERLFKATEKVTKNGCGKIMETVMLADSANPKANPAKAVKALEKLLPDHPEASFWLARLYDEGSGAAKDTARAKALYEKAQAMGYTPDLAAFTTFLASL